MRRRRDRVRHLATLRPAKLIVTVVDGNRNTRVRGARVQLWHRAARTNGKGEVVIRVPDRKDMYVSVGARGYGGRTVFEPFARFRRVTVRVYRPNLQWRMYGATPVARAGAGAHPSAAAVQDGLVRAARRPRRVPRRRRQRRRVCRQPQRHGLRDHDAAGPRAVAAPHERDDGVVARRVRHRARPPLHAAAASRCSTARRGTCAGATTSARRSSRRRSSGTTSTTSARGTGA